MGTVNLFTLMSVLFSGMLMYCYSFPTTLVLERVDSVEIDHSEVIARDRLRHNRVFLHSSSSSLPGVVQFPLHGSANPHVFGRYFTRVKLGNPPRDYSLLIDTGSDVTWVNCVSCTGCPRSSGVIQLSFYDLHNSSSSASISCSDKRCKSAQFHGCSSSLCTYSLPYGDGSVVSGYYVSDMFRFHTVRGSSVTAITSGDIVFGCSNSESGVITRHDTALDGLLGLGHHPISIPSQLASRQVTPNIFGHCLGGDRSGGGMLVLGEIQAPGIVYTPLILSEPHYNVNLLSISIGRKTVPIRPEVFATSRNQGTVIDSGSTYTYLAEEAYDAFVTALVSAVSPIVSPFSDSGAPCFLISNSDTFPQVILNFAGGASMILRPEEYIQKHLNAGPGIWCLAFQKNQLQISHRLTILGEQILKDKIIIYDLARKRLGWANYDCTSSLNVSFVPPRVSRASRDAVFIVPFFKNSFGDRDLDWRLSNSRHLCAILEDKRYSKCSIVLLHASYPFPREASYLASVTFRLYNQVYLDFGLAVPKLSVHGVISSVKELLELAPTKKVMFNDGYAVAETFYLGAGRACQAVSSVLCGACNDGDLSVLEAVEAAEDILKNNAIRLYKINELVDSSRNADDSAIMGV